MKELVSVIIPTHNRADLLPRSINSVLNQTYDNLEIIVVSDGSTDDTELIIDDYCKKDKRIKKISYKESKGGNAARNLGINSCKGKYIAFLDDDDEWYPDKLDQQVKIMENDKNIGLVYTGVHAIYVNENINYDSIPSERGDLSNRILIDNCIGTTSTVMIKKDVIEKSGGFDNNLKALQDYDLWIRIAKYTKVDYIKKPMINYYNYLGKNQISAITQKYVDSFNYINNKYEEDISKLAPNDLKMKKVEEYFLLANKSMRNNNPKLSRHYLRKLLRVRFSIKGLIYYILSYTSYATVLKIRSIKG